MDRDSGAPARESGAFSRWLSELARGMSNGIPDRPNLPRSGQRRLVAKHLMTRKVRRARLDDNGRVRMALVDDDVTWTHTQVPPLKRRNKRRARNKVARASRKRNR